MTPLIGIATVVFLGLTLWLYDHGLANVLESLAIRLIRHARWLLGAPTLEEMVGRR